jgi:NADH:ubiquinone oxidoreductase subunit K
MNGPTLEHYLIFSALLFSLGVYGILTRRNLVAMLMSVELVLNAAALNFVAFHHFAHSGDSAGAIFPVFIITVAAAEAAIALAIIIALFRHKNELDAQSANLLKH